VKYYDRTGDVNADEQRSQGQQQYEGVQPTQRVFLNLYTGQTSPVYYDSKGQLLVPCPVYDHVYVQQHGHGQGQVVGGGGPVPVEPKQKSGQPQHQPPVGVVKQVPVAVSPVAYNINNVGSQVPQRQQQESQQQTVSVAPPPPQPVPVPVVQHSVGGQGNFVPIPVPSQVVYDRYHQHVVNSQQQQSQQVHVQSPFQVTSTPDVIYYAVPTSTSGIPVAVQAPQSHAYQVHQQVQNGHGQGQGPVQFQVPVPYGHPVYTGLPFDVPYQVVVASPPGSYYPYVYVKQATPTVSVQHSTQSSSSQVQVPGQVQVKNGEHQQQEKKDVDVKGVESH